MRFSISHIAWNAASDEEVFFAIKNCGFFGLEIAPTKIFPKNPYGNLGAAKKWAGELKLRHGFCVSSLQSIWFGKTEKLFGTDSERKILFSHTKNAIDFACALECKNLVFGSPKNRNITKGVSKIEAQNIAAEFFCALGIYAASCGAVISLEANPAIYGTNFLNETSQAFDLAQKINSPAVKVNLDLGTMIQNCESEKILFEKIHLVNHVHVSEPFLRSIKKRSLHKKVAKILRKENYSNFISIEMSEQKDVSKIEKICRYVREVFE